MRPFYTYFEFATGRVRLAIEANERSQVERASFAEGPAQQEVLTEAARLRLAGRYVATLQPTLLRQKALLMAARLKSVGRWDCEQHCSPEILLQTQVHKRPTRLSLRLRG
jgi:hypothetical protein